MGEENDDESVFKLPKSAVKNKKKFKNTFQDTKTNYVSDNMFSCLSDEAEESEVESSPKVRRRKVPNKKSSLESKDQVKVKHKTTKIENPTQTQSKPPPITIINLNIVEIENKFKTLSIPRTSLEAQLCNVGVKIFVKNDKEYETLKAFCIQNQIEFYSHTTKNNRKIKMVLYGLPEMDTEEIENVLKEFNINPLDIKKMIVKEPKFELQCNYLLYFKKSDNIRISDLKQVRTLFQIKVRWQYYVHRREGPTQCSNCQRFSHGTENCYLKPKCIRCGKPHKSNDCPLRDPSNPTQKTPRANLKCANCNGNHVASYQKCPARLEAIEKKKLVARKFKTSGPENHSSNTFKNAPELNDFNYPSLSSNTKAWHNGSIKNNILYSHHMKSTSSNLLSAQECYSIFNEFIDALINCETRVQQLKVIGEITFKYLEK